MSELNEEVRVTVDDAPVATVPLVDNFTADNAAPKASAVGTALAAKADIANIMNYVTITVDGQESDNQGVILLNADEIPIDDTNNAPSVKDKIDALDAKTAANIVYALNVSVKDKIDDVAAAVAAVDAKTAESIIYADTTTIKTKVDGIEATLGTVQAATAGTVRITAQSFTDAEKQQARTNIGAAASAEAVSVNQQSFTTVQQAQARTNIGALGAGDAVLVDVQTLTTSQQAQARTNIGAISGSEAVLLTAQTLTTGQQEQARANIGAASTAAVEAAARPHAIVRQITASASVSIAAGGSATVLGVCPEETGYTPAGIVGHAVWDASSGGTGFGSIVSGHEFITNGQYTVMLHNKDTVNAAVVQLMLFILYLKA